MVVYISLSVDCDCCFTPEARINGVFKTYEEAAGAGSSVLKIEIEKEVPYKPEDTETEISIKTELTQIW